VRFLQILATGQACRTGCSNLSVWLHCPICTSHTPPFLIVFPQSGAVDPRELEHLLRWPRAAAPPPMSDELQAWMGEAQWAALVPLAQLPTFAGLLKVLWVGLGGLHCFASCATPFHLNANAVPAPHVSP